jgi:hypothetical protein
VEAKLWQGCFKGLWVADAELDLDLNRLHGRSLYRFHNLSCPVQLMVKSGYSHPCSGRSQPGDRSRRSLAQIATC